MCNARFVYQVPQKLARGPASDAVEKSNKRQRSALSRVAEGTAVTSFNFDALFDAVCEEDAFPSIGWDIEDRSFASCSMSSSSLTDSMSSDDEDYSEGAFTAGKGNKRARSGMLRSISIMTDLALLEPSTDKCNDKTPLIQIRRFDELLKTRFHSSLMPKPTEPLSVAACAS
ncbi:hypothetical protein MPSEU_001032400 [Mayamaea pseudoterrestris]|nr:hypothetical protein MPSEU_001032400 [Mayamaea pseudoterrestris]